MLLLVVLALVELACGGRSPGGADAAPDTAAHPLAMDFQSVHQSFNDSGRPKLQFVGDSITWLAFDDLNRRFGPTHDVAISAHVGYDTLREAPAVAQAAKLDPRIAVINLGTNDAASMLNGHGAPDPPQPLSAVEARYAKFFAEFPPSTCVIFVTINTHNPSWNPAGATAINDYLKRTYTHIADWSADWSPTYFDHTDDPHPNARGLEALTVTLDHAIAGCPH